MRLLFLMISWGLSVAVMQAQTLETLTNIPLDVEETSGMIISSANGVWMHNDSGDSAKLYKIDTLGNLLRTILVSNATHIDWEDITRAPNGDTYIGDFGNNDNERQDLKIYRIPHPDSVTGNTVTAEVLAFTYPDQTAFPPADSFKHFDMEAMIYYQGYLYLFSKNRTNPYNSYTKLYQLPADTGTHVAVLLDSFNTQQPGSAIFSITAAAISPDSQQVALLNANTVWLFSNFTGHNFFQGQLQIIPLGSITQKEAIDFLDNQTLYISDERNSILGTCRLYRYRLNQTLTYVQEVEKQPNSIRVYPNPSKGRLTLDLNLLADTKISIRLRDQQGKRLKKWKAEEYKAGKHQVKLNFEELKGGLAWYLLEIRLDGKPQTYRIMMHE